MQVLQIYIEDRGDEARVGDDATGTLAAPKEKYSELISMLKGESEVELGFLICDVVDVSDADRVAGILVSLFRKWGRSLAFVAGCAAREVSKTQYAATLFRSNSMASRLMRVLGRVLAAGYLRSVLLPVIERLLAIPKPTDLELDPAKAPVLSTMSESEVQSRVRRLQDEIDYCFSAIVGSASQCPTDVRRLCRRVRNSVRQKHPGSEHLAVAAFLFLRFFCPALVSPESFGLLATPPSEEHRRILLLMTKALQNLASGVSSFKEQHMAGLQPFLVANRQRMFEFFERICDVPDEVCFFFPPVSFS